MAENNVSTELVLAGEKKMYLVKFQIPQRLGNRA